jgi:hypothetical protein
VNYSKHVRAFDVPQRVLNELRSDVGWHKMLKEATTFQEWLLVVKRFCLERGYQIHHNVVTGRLVVCRN